MEELNINILLIEDNPDDAELMKRRLSRSSTAKFKVTVVNTLRDGLTRLEQENPDLIISDLGLPDSHGLDTVSKILKKAPQTALVVLSGFDDESTAIKAVKAGAQDYLVKGQLEGVYMERSLFYAIERARMQRELGEHAREILSIQTNLLKILEKNADAIIVVGEDKKILFTNPAVETLLGQNQKDLINRPFNYPLDGGKTTEIEISRPDKARTIAEMRVVDITWEGKTAHLASLRNITERKKAEEALRESEEKFSKAFRSSPEAIVIASINGGAIKEANDTFFDATGFTREEVIGKKSSELGAWFSIKDLERMKKEIREKGEVRNAEVILRNKSGEKRTKLLSAELIHIGNEPCILSVTTDITERKQMEEVVRNSEKNLRMYLENAPDGIFTIDMKGVFLYGNKRIEAIAGYSVEEMINRNILELKLIHKEDHPAIARLLKAAAGSNPTGPTEINITNKNGDIVWLEVNTTPIRQEGELRAIGFIRDITERKRDQEALRESEEKFSKAFRSSPESIVIARLADGTIQEANDTFFQTTGYTREEIINVLPKSAAAWANPEDRGRMLKILKEKGSVRNQEFLFRNKSGEARVKLYSAELINFGNEPCILSSTTDITERKQAEEALRQSEEKFSKVFNANVNPICVVTVEGLNFIDVNESFLRFSGYTREEIIGNSSFKLNLWVNKDDPLSMAKTFNEKGSLYNVEFENRTKSGEIRTGLFSGEIIKIVDKWCIILVITDITERKKAEEALRESEEKFSKVFRSSPDAIIISRINDGNILDANDSFFLLSGYTPEEIIGKKITQLGFWVSPKDGENMARTLREKRAFRNIECLLRMKSGASYTMLLSAEMINIRNQPCILTVASDITERKKAEEALEESEEKFSKAFRSSPQVIVISRLSDSTMLEINDTFLRLTGYTREEVIGRKSSELDIWAKPEERAAMVKELQEKGSIRNSEYTFRMKSGELRIWLFSAEIATIRNEQCILSVTTDITERKIAEEKLRQLDQMKSEFLSNVSHELRTPLQSIGGFTKLIMNGQVPDPVTRQEFLQIIDREALHLGNLIDSLLDMSRLEAGRFQINRKLVPVRDYFTDPVKSFYSLARDKNITLDENIPEQLPEMEVDGERLRQVVINLLGNAIKFSDPGGSVTVKVEKQQSQLLFQVSDRGIGISEEAKKHLFERFYRAEGEMVRGGTGLGLYISRQIIEAHGGRIWADSKLGEGSTFSFTLPLNSIGGKDNGKKNPGN